MKQNLWDRNRANGDYQTNTIQGFKLNKGKARQGIKGMKSGVRK